MVNCGSFTKAADKIHISPTAIMKRMNTLESYIGVQLIIRSPRGIILTKAGQSLYKDSKKISSLSRECIMPAKITAHSEHLTIRIGTSLLYPYFNLMNLWNKVKDTNNNVKFKIVPFNYTYRETWGEQIGNKFDIIAGIFHSEAIPEHVKFIEIKKSHFCISLPISHRLAKNNIISSDDLHEEHLIVMPFDNSSIYDSIIKNIKKAHSEIILEHNIPYDIIDIFNYIEENNYVLLTLDCWKNIHPSLVTIPFDIKETIPYGIIHSTKTSAITDLFLNIIKSNVNIK